MEDTLELSQKREREIIAEREKHKQRVRVLTKDLYNLRQKMRYIKTTEKKQARGVVFEMFGKKFSELTPDELRQYNAYMQNKKRKNL